MLHSRRGLRAASILLAATAAATWLTPQAPAVAAVAIPHNALAPDSVRESMEYLKKSYGISDAEALRRLELQADAQSLAEKLDSDASDAYGGMWIDQDNGGRLVVLSTNRPAVDPYVRGMADNPHVDVQLVRHSLKELRTVMSRLNAKAGVDASSVATSIFIPAVSMMENRVLLQRRDWIADAKAQGTLAQVTGAPAKLPATAAARSKAVTTELAAARAAAAAEAPGLVEERQLKQPQQYFTPYVDWGYCHPLYCSTKYGPMRGGLRLNIKRDNGTWGGCTSGFNVRSTGGTTYNNWAWVLTAGHCTVGKTNNTYIHHNGYNILKQHAPNAALEVNSFPVDFVMLPYIDGSYSQTWLDNFTGKNRVMKYCRNGGQDSDSDTPCGTQATTANQYITGYHSLDQINPGWVACASGTATSTTNYADSYFSGHNDSDNAGYLVGTRCGKVITPKDGSTIWTDICARLGDSGGPLFSQVDQTAYGILEGSYQSRTGACYSGEINNYIPISSGTGTYWGVYEYSNNVAGATYRVITSSAG